MTEVDAIKAMFVLTVQQITKAPQERCDKLVQDVIQAGTRNMVFDPSPINDAATEQLKKLAEAVRVFRNDPLLERLGGLRGKPGYRGLVLAWEDVQDFLNNC